MKSNLFKFFLFTTIGFIFSGCHKRKTMHSNLDVYAHEQFDGFKANHSPYLLEPGDSIGVCDNGVRKDVADHVVSAIRLWLNAADRDSRVSIFKGCQADRVIQLWEAKADDPDMPFYGKADPLKDNSQGIFVNSTMWSGVWTSNHEVGHLFGFGHPSNDFSIMRSPMVTGQMQQYDLNEIKRLLSLDIFSKVNAEWADKNYNPKIRLGIILGDGMKITEIWENSPVKTVLAKGDVLKQIDSIELRSYAQLRQILRKIAKAPNGTKFEIRYVRNDQELSHVLANSDLIL